MERLDHALQFGWAADLWENLKEAVSADYIKRLIEINESDVRSLHFSCNCRREKTMSIVERSARKPHCDSG